MSYSPDILLDGDYRQPSTFGAPRYVYPFRQNGDRASAYIEQDYWQTWATFTPQELIIPHPTFRDMYLVKETPPVPLFADVVQFTRTWARIPATQNVYSTASFNKPLLTEFATGFNANGVTGAGTSNIVYPVYYYSSHYWDGQNNRVYGPYVVTTSADSGSDTRVTWPSAHGITTGRFIIQASGERYIFASGDYTVVNSTTIDLLGWQFDTNATQACKYLRDYSSGPDTIVTKEVSQFYLPGISAGITTPADITIPASLLNDAAFLAAALANTTGFVNYEVDSLEQWMESSIYVLKTTQINMGDL
jgi:hypothetical protein